MIYKKKLLQGSRTIKLYQPWEEVEECTDVASPAFIPVCPTMQHPHGLDDPVSMLTWVIPSSPQWGGVRHPRRSRMMFRTIVQISKEAKMAFLGLVGYRYIVGN
jgi:hypothetical protein